MTLIFGGAYQGKLSYSLERFNLSEEDVWNCTQGKPDYSRKVLYKMEEVILEKIKKGENPVAFLESQLEILKDKIIIITDLSCGVVPTDPLMRKWREAVGRCSALLARHSDSVIRVFCGIGTELK